MPNGYTDNFESPPFFGARYVVFEQRSSKTGPVCPDLEADQRLESAIAIIFLITIAVSRR
jgi:hypothetical protein